MMLVMEEKHRKMNQSIAIYEKDQGRKQNKQRDWSCIEGLTQGNFHIKSGCVDLRIFCIA